MQSSNLQTNKRLSNFYFEGTKMRTLLIATLFVALIGISNPCLAQFAGARGGVSHSSSRGAAGDDFAPLDLHAVKGYITVEGKAELRVKPTQIRIVLAVISEDATSMGCSELVKKTVSELKKSWDAIGIKKSNMNEDFIAILPRYEWQIENRNGKSVGVEKKVGYRMQSNMHVSVPDESKALEVLEKAYQAGVTDIIAFDYWSKEIDEWKIKARKKAIETAKEKSTTLLALFDEKPKIINIQEKTKTYFPKMMYESFQNTYDSATYRPTRRDMPFIGAHRPKNTYYRGLDIDSDVRADDFAMKREISVVSTVRIYYRSPAATDEIKAKKTEKK